VDTSDYARWFRDSTPYISRHRNSTFVVLLDGAAFNSANLANIVHDLALVHVLGARLVLVHGARPQLDRNLTDSVFHQGRRITRPADLPAITGTYGELRSRLEAMFSTGLPSSPLHQTDIAVISGNFITAQPLGIVDGVDHELTGATRKVHTSRLRLALDSGALVLLSPIGYSPSGQAFNLASDELATDVALALGADKLVIFNPAEALTGDNGERLSVMSPSELDTYLSQQSGADVNHLHCALRACRGGVKNTQLIGYEKDGALLNELYTAKGDGTQITESLHDLIRPARQEDVASIVEIIRPLEDQGILVRRSRDRLEQEIGHFLVAEIDSTVVGCCAVYPYENAAELACVVVHPSYRDRLTDEGSGQLSIGSALLEAAEAAARTASAQNLFALTTQTRDWFLENGFIDNTPDALPAPKQALYNYQRNSRVMIKPLD
jgi:amino-acid N-acetyltransferase